MFESLNEKKYSIIYADPPWTYDNVILSPKTLNSTYAELHYPTMPLKEICAMDILSIAEQDCLLFMWATSPMLPEALEVGEAWGFDYSTVGFIWHKQNTTLGHYTMGECELCLTFKRKGGKIPKPRGSRGVKQFVSAQRGRHSEKPIEVRHRIHKMFPKVAKVELFARGLDFFGGKIEDPHWDFWGNEA